MHFPNLANCMEDAARQLEVEEQSTVELPSFQVMVEELESYTLPALHSEAMRRPLLETLKSIGPEGYEDLLKRRYLPLLIKDIHLCLRQRSQKDQPMGPAIFALQEFVSDVFDGFLSAEDRHRVAAPERQVLSPLVKFGTNGGPYTHTIQSTSQFRCQTSVVCLPFGATVGGLMVWSTIVHELCGHTVLAADRGLRGELADLLNTALQSFGHIRGYLVERIEETASDVLGCLNMGPYGALGTIAMLRALDHGSLARIGPGDQVHPAGYLRALIVLECVRLLRFRQANDWADALLAEAQRDLPENAALNLDGNDVDLDTAQQVAILVARALSQSPLQSLEGRRLSDIQNWNDHDERKTRELAFQLENYITPKEDFYATHLVAAAVDRSVQAGANLSAIFMQMREHLAAEHRVNPSFGPLLIPHPGDLPILPFLAERS